MKSKLKNKLAVKFLTAISIVLFAAITVLTVLVSHYITKEINDQENQNLINKNESIYTQLDVNNDLVLQQVKSSMRLLKTVILNDGNPSLGSVININGKKAYDILFGNNSTANNYKAVDHIRDLDGGTATIFSKYQNEFIRISTNVTKDDGSRAVGTILNPKGKAYKNIMQGKSYYGLVNILNKPYLTGYEPIFNSNKKVIGMYYTGFELSSLARLNNLISKSRVLKNGFVALLDNNKEVVLHSDNMTHEYVINIMKNYKDLGWNVHIKKYEKWGYYIISGYPEADVNDMVFSANIKIVLGGIIAMLVILGLNLWLIVKFIIKPVSELNNAANKIASGKEFTKVNVNSTDEIGNLAESFNQMIQKIKEGNEALIVEKNSIQKKVEEAVKESEEQKDYLTRNVDLMLKEINKFSNGDLTVKLNAEKHDEIKKTF